MAGSDSIQPELVVKIGGSLMGDLPRLRSVLRLLASSNVPLVVVPGGGRFADGVREAQTRMGFSEACAHDLAILAMKQTAGVFCDLQPGLVVVDHLSDALSALDDGCVPLLVPLAELKKDASFPKTWAATSDAIAAWAGVKLKAHQILFVKSRRAPAACGPGDLASAGVLDPVSPGILAGGGLEAIIIGPGEEDVLARAVGRRD